MHVEVGWKKVGGSFWGSNGVDSRLGEDGIKQGEGGKDWIH